MWDLPPPPSAATREDGLVDEQLPESRPGADQGRTASSLTASGPQVASPTSKLSPATQVALDFETRFGWALIVMLVVEAQLTVTVGVVMPLSSEGPITAERNNTLGTSGGQLRGSSIDGHLGGRRSGPYSGGGGGEFCRTSRIWRSIGHFLMPTCGSTALGGAVGTNVRLNPSSRWPTQAKPWATSLRMSCPFFPHPPLEGPQSSRPHRRTQESCYPKVAGELLPDTPWQLPLADLARSNRCSKVAPGAESRQTLGQHCSSVGGTTRLKQPLTRAPMSASPCEATSGCGSEVVCIVPARRMAEVPVRHVARRAALVCHRFGTGHGAMSGGAGGFWNRAQICRTHRNLAEPGAVVDELVPRSFELESNRPVLGATWPEQKLHLGHHRPTLARHRQIVPDPARPNLWANSANMRQTWRFIDRLRADVGRNWADFDPNWSDLRPRLAKSGRGRLKLALHHGRRRRSIPACANTHGPKLTHIAPEWVDIISSWPIPGQDWRISEHNPVDIAQHLRMKPCQLWSELACNFLVFTYLGWVRLF